MKSRSVFVGLFIGLFAAMSGCGGGGGGGVSGTSGTNSNPYAGTYSTTYTRAAITGSLMIFVGTDGSVTVSLLDSTAGHFTGTGTITTNGQIDIKAAEQTLDTLIHLLFSLVKQGATITGTGSISGAITQNNMSVQQIASGSANAFAGTYSGTYSTLSPPGPGGTWTVTISSGGSVSGSAQDNSGGAPQTLSGTVSQSGALGGNGGANNGAKWIGNWYRGSDGKYKCSGTWTNTLEGIPLSGTWSGQQS